MALSTQLTITEVDRRIERPGVGPIYSLSFTVDEFYDALTRGLIQFSERFSGPGLERVLDRCLGHVANAERMAAQSLFGIGLLDDVVLNLRTDEIASYSSQDRCIVATDAHLVIPTLPERALAVYLIGRWKNHPETISNLRIINPIFTKQAIVDAAADAGDNRYWGLIYNLSPRRESALAEEFETDWDTPRRRPSASTTSPEGRFVRRLQEICPVLAPEEIETGPTIGSKSRKLIILTSLLEAFSLAIDRHRLMELEGSGAYEDLVEFVGAVFGQWAEIFTAWSPGSSAAERHTTRENTLALSNLIVYPLARLAIEWWSELGRDPERLKHTRRRMDVGAPILARHNHRWHGRVVDRGARRGVSNTHDAREFVYEELSSTIAQGA